MKTKAFRETYKEEEVKEILGDLGTDFSNEMDFEGFLKVSQFMSSPSHFISSGRHSHFVGL